MLKILLVDDSAIMRKMLLSSISSIGEYQFIECKNGAQALEYLEANHDVDCIFLDINMPVMGGLELIDALKQKGIYDNQNIIIASTEVYNLSQKLIDELNVLGVMPKPFNKKEINSTLIPLLEIVQNKMQIQKCKFLSPILVVDDSISMRKILKKQLSTLGCCNFYEAVDGVEALKLINEHIDTLSLVFIDLHMPKMDGMALIQKLKKEKLLKKINPVLISGDETRLHELGSKYPEVELIPKPFKQKDLNNTVLPILQKLDPKNFQKTTDIEIKSYTDIQTRVSIEDSIHHYFFDYYEYIQTNSHLLHSKKRLPYFSYKNFLYFAIEKLQELDSEFIQEHLSKELEELKQLEKQYKNLGVITGAQKREVFYHAFLSNQKEYTKLQEVTQIYKKNIIKGGKKLQELEAFNSDEKGDEKSSAHIRQIKTKLQKLQDAYKNNLRLIEEYERKNFEDFELKYNLLRKNVKDNIASILGTKIYRLNKLLWENANNNAKIRQYYYKKSIPLPLQAREFLKHYLQTTSLSHDNLFYKEMLEVLTLLQKQKRQSVTIVYDDVAELETLKEIVTQIDKDLIVQGYTNIKYLLQNKTQEQDLIILDFNIRGLGEDLKELQKRYGDCDFLLLFQTRSKKDIFDAIASGLFHPTVKNYLHKPKFLNPTELKHKVKELL
ncbi:MAG: response regulator [Campylobacterota bacterium]